MGIGAKVRLQTVHIFAYSYTREQSNKRCRTRLKTESETGERHFSLSPHTPVGCVRLAQSVRIRLLRHVLPITDFEEKIDCFAVYAKVRVEERLSVRH